MSSMSMQYAALTSAVGEVKHTADQLDRGRSTLHESFASFLGGGWTGQAAESFRGGWDDWSTGVGEVLEALGDLADLMDAHRADLQQQDDGARGSVDLLNARLGDIGGRY